MMRSLWTAASGMTAQQLSVDTIANNLANVNTTGYKKERMEFKSLLYDTMERATLDAGVDASKPVNLQVGHGVRPIAVSRIMTNGGAERTDSPLDVFIEGEGFFAVQHGDMVSYTRDGTFKLSIDGDTATIVTSEGYPLLDTNGDAIEFDSNINTKDIIIDLNGFLYNREAGNNETVDMGIQLEMVQFPNVQGLEAVGSNLFNMTSNSGEPIQESSGDTSSTSKIVQGYLELSNVQVAEEMVKLIVSQRAYELNSKAITTSDDMLQTANNLKK